MAQEMGGVPVAVAASSEDDFPEEGLPLGVLVDQLVGYGDADGAGADSRGSVSYTHLRAHET